MNEILEIILLISLTIFTFHYVFFITRVHLGLIKLKPAEPKIDKPFISVIISVRNEEKKILECLKSLNNQTYPKNKYEVIVVDDGSTDKTIDIVLSYLKENPNINVIFFNENKIQSSKTIAITKGIERAKGEIILTTDADCIVPPRWIETMVNYFNNDVALVAGPVIEKSKNSFFNKLEQLELLGLISTAAGLIGSHRPIICNGANLGYRKDSFLAANGFGNTANDDELLMNRIFVRKLGKIKFASDVNAIVITDSSNTLLSFFKQRIRWANKRGHYEDKTILVSLVALYFFFLSLLILGVMIPFNTKLILPFSIAFIGKVIVDYFTLRTGGKLFNQRIPIFYFLIAEILHTPYIVIAAAVGQFANLKWKERKIN